MRSPEGQDFWSTGTYQTVDAPAKLVLTDSFADEHGNVVSAAHYGMAADFPLESLITVTFDEQNGRSTFTLKSDDVSAIPERDLKDMQNGWNESFDKLEVLLKNEQSVPHGPEMSFC